MRTGEIYGLCEPDGELRYIGRTVRGAAKRRGGHLKVARAGHQSHLYNWIRGLLARDSGPALWVLEDEIPEEDLNEREIVWIAACRVWGVRLVNGTDGGQTGSGIKFHKEGCTCLFCSEEGPGGCGHHSEDCTCPYCVGGRGHHSDNCPCAWCRGGQGGNSHHRPDCSCTWCTGQIGDSNPAKRPEVQAKMRAKWTPERRASQAERARIMGSQPSDNSASLHARWHTARKITSSECKYCREEEEER